MHIKVWITENGYFDMVLIYCASTSTGLPTSEPPTTPTETMPPITTQPPSGPLMVSFMGNTPLVVLNTVTVQVFTNKPASATCRLGRAATKCEGLDRSRPSHDNDTSDSGVPKYVTYSNTVTSPLAFLSTV